MGMQTGRKVTDSYFCRAFCLVTADTCRMSDNRGKNERDGGVRAGSRADGLGFLPCFYMILGACVSRQVPWGGGAGFGRRQKYMFAELWTGRNIGFEATGREWVFMSSEKGGHVKENAAVYCT